MIPTWFEIAAADQGFHRQAFIVRGLASAAQAKKTGKYVPAGRVIEKLARKLAKAKQRAA